jgi:hypothetical protein
MGNMIHKPFSFLVKEENTSYKLEFGLDKNVRIVTGLLLSSSDPRKLFFRGSQRIEIDGKELFPDGFESKLLMSGISVSPNERFIEIGEVPSGNCEVKIQYMDEANDNAPFSPYKVMLVLKCEGT